MSVLQGMYFVLAQNPQTMTVCRSGIYKKLGPEKYKKNGMYIKNGGMSFVNKDIWEVILHTTEGSASL